MGEIDRSALEKELVRSLSGVGIGKDEAAIIVEFLREGRSLNPTYLSRKLKVPYHVPKVALNNLSHMGIIERPIVLEAGKHVNYTMQDLGSSLKSYVDKRIDSLRASEKAAAEIMSRKQTAFKRLDDFDKGMSSTRDHYIDPNPEFCDIVSGIGLNDSEAKIYSVFLTLDIPMGPYEISGMSRISFKTVDKYVYGMEKKGIVKRSGDRRFIHTGSSGLSKYVKSVTDRMTKSSSRIILEILPSYSGA